ncbi:MAG: adenylate kinase family protein [Methanosphaera sp.]|nr:adenylate kinase family protein [Methanosphaera sp.]
MMIIITGTPGCGKTTVSDKLSKKTNSMLISINSLLDDYDLDMGIDDERGYRIVDTEAMIPIIDNIRNSNPEDDIVFEGHLAHDYPNADCVIILRCNPDVLSLRLDSRGWSDKKVQENISAEILGICTSEAYETYGDNISEIDTSNLSIDEVVDDIMGIISGSKSYPAGQVDYLADYFSYLN